MPRRLKCGATHDRVKKLSREAGGCELVQRPDLLRGGRGQRAFCVGCDLKQVRIGLLRDLDRNGLRVVARNVVASEPGKQAVACAMVRILGGAIERAPPEGLERLQARMPAG